MREHRKYFSVNWIDGMKINKNHFIDQDNAWVDALHQMGSLNVSPLRYGVLPASSSGENNFNVKVSLDNQGAVKVSVISCQAVTSGGILISIPTISENSQSETGMIIAETFPLSAGKNDAAWWVFLFVQPFDKQPAGTGDLAEMPPRQPYVVPTYTLKLVSETNYNEYAYSPYAMPVGLLTINGKDVQVDENYLPPCFSIVAHPDLMDVLENLDKYFATIELYCSRTIQKINTTEQGKIAQQVKELFDKVLIYTAHAISDLRLKMIYEAPVEMFIVVSKLARIMKNTLDLGIGSGKDELMNYMAEWTKLKPGELEGILGNMANSEFNNNNINKSIMQVVEFVNATKVLFKTASELTLIGPLPPPPPEPEKRKFVITTDKTENETKEKKPSRFL